MKNHKFTKLMIENKLKLIDSKINKFWKYRILRILTPPCQKISPKTAKGVRLHKIFN